MGLVRAEIELINTEDVGLVRRGFLKDTEIRHIKVNALVDSGAYMMVVPEAVRLQLGLAIVAHKVAEYANGQIEEVPICGPLDIHFSNRETTVRAMVTGNEVLLGAIPMEDMDVLIDPRSQQLIVNPDHPTMPQMIVKRVPNS